MWEIMRARARPRTGGGPCIVVAVAEVRVVFDGENLFEIMRAGECGGLESAGNGDDPIDEVRIASGKV